MVLLVCISIFWIKASWEDERTNLQREATILFRNAVHDVEDSLRSVALETGIWPGPQAGRRTRVVMMDSTQMDSTRISIRGARGQRLRRRPNRDPSDQSFEGALSLHFMMANADSLSQGIPWQDTVSRAYVLARLQRKVWQLQENKDWQLQLFLADSSSHTRTELMSRMYRDLLTGRKIGGEIRGAQRHIWKNTLPEVLLSALMLIVTGLAFWLTHKNSIRQEKLAILKDELISNITHELQTPIATVKVALEALNGSEDLTQTKASEYLSITQHEVDRLSQLVDAVLQNSKGSPLESARLPVDLHQLLLDILSRMSPYLEEINARITHQAKGQSFLINGDRSQLESVFYNLIDNAAKYGGKNPVIQIDLERHDNNICIKVRDQGMGIPLSYQSQIFDRFFRVPQHDRHDTKGYGLGLTQVKRIVEAHDGKVTVQSREGEGTTFSITFPVDKKQSQETT